MSLTAPLIAGALKVETSAPVVALMRATLFALTPLTFAMRPPRYTVPSPASTMSNTSFVPTFGVKAVSTAPVVALNAKMLLRVNVAPPADAAAVTDVNLPTAMIRLPIWTIASTLPWLTLGVKFAGSAETMWSMVGSDACAGARAVQATVAAATARRAARTDRERVRNKGFSQRCRGCGGRGSRSPMVTGEETCYDAVFSESPCVVTLSNVRQGITGLFGHHCGERRYPG